MKTTMIDLEKLSPAPYNPRRVDDAQLNSICASLVEFGIVEPFVVRKEDNLIIGGHQRLKAIKKLLAGEYKVRGKVVPFALPKNEIPVVYVDGLTDERAKMLNLALNKVGGEWDHVLLGNLLSELNESIGDALTASGFSPAEIADYIDVADALGTDDDGTMPAPPTKAPNIVLDFSSKELRDAVKQYVAAATVPGKLGGDVLAEKLGVTPTRARPRARRARAAEAS